MDGGEEEAMNNLGFWRSTPRRRRQPSSRGSYWATTCKCGKPRCRGLKKAVEFDNPAQDGGVHARPPQACRVISAARGRGGAPRRARGQAMGAGGRAPEDGAAQ
ncbi:hypothetical protein C2845_PM14G05450 [Panicum miliaceum]|uniref:Uncharacterized protein n=1 Tax=Panicum miliaceum TaxID=4540 RepID=A0A3L6PS64_PANMI|nr:hypothetical protein C2845_PM14G05450 [Panicum miliaceum]